MSASSGAGATDAGRVPRGAATPGGAPRSIAVLTHGREEETGAALELLIERARAAGVTLRFDAEEANKHGLVAATGVDLLQQAPRAIVRAAPASEESLCVVLGGDGTILRALRRYAGTDVPVFDQLRRDRLPRDGRARGSQGRHPSRPRGGTSSCCDCPRSSSRPRTSGDRNDVAIHRRAGERVAELVAYELDGEEVGSVRCDGLVIATPAGSTGYNLANGGPVMAWGVEGFAASFIAPHSITARALVAAPSDTITIHNRSREALDVAVDGRPCASLRLAVRSARGSSTPSAIAQLPAPRSTAACARSSGASPAERRRVESPRRSGRASTAGARRPRRPLRRSGGP